MRLQYRNRKNTALEAVFSFADSGLCLQKSVVSVLEALAAVDGTVALGLEGHLGLSAAGGADSGEVLPRAAGGVLAGVAAGLAALGLVLEAALCVELLLTGGEHELLAALFAH